MESTQFDKKYKQLNLLGKGNYGKVYKVKLNDGSEGKDAKYFVAKRMYLEGLSEQDIKSAYGEIEILQKLNKQLKRNPVPFIVQYQQFFRTQTQLIIIMQYCECGDLSTFLKNAKKNGERLNEKVIGYWLIMLLFGMKVLHSKNILHRDLKSANIFLTKTHALKIGDFGISKVLQRSSAITCIGTPLYLSPQVCNNQPYGFSSDMWAVGCILYQMCSLRYPFEASNMIVLAKKIVMDNVAPIPEYYDKQLNELVMRMFEKDNKKRITVDQIFKSFFIKKYIQSFVKDNGQIKDITVPIAGFVKQPATVVSKEEQDTMKTINSVVQRSSGNQTINNTLEYTKTLTHKQRIALQKQQKAKQQFQRIKQATIQSSFNLTKAKQEKLKNLSQTNQWQNKSNKFEEQKKAMIHNKIIAQNKTKEKYEQNIMQKAQTININDIFNTISNMKTMGSSKNIEEIQLPSHSQFVPIINRQEQRTIRPAKHRFQQQIQQDIPQQQQLQQYYDDDFQQYTEQDNIQKTQKIKFFQNQLEEYSMSPSKKQRIFQPFKPLAKNDPLGKIQTRIDSCIKLVPRQRYEQLYKLKKSGKITNVPVGKNSPYTIQQQKVLYFIQEIIEFEK